jgi:protein gp37
MAENSSIEWCDSTFNPWIGCTKVSQACDHCYAEARMDTRLHRVKWGASQPRVRTQTWGDPKKWEKRHEAFYAKHGRRQRVFCASLADVFDNQVPEEWRSDLFELIRVTPNLDWLLLTKRPQNIVRMVQANGAIAGNGTRYLPCNVWLGTTAEDQTRADQNINALLRTRAELGARVLFLSAEPLLGPLDLVPYIHCDVANTLDWVIVGGESGHHARPMHPDWARSLRDQCQVAGVPFLFKQWGEWLPLDHQRGGADPEERQCHIWPDGRPYDGENEDMTLECVQLSRVGKKAAGRLLDGRSWDGFPEVPAP